MISEKTLRFLKKRSRWFDVIVIDGESSPVSFKNNRVHSILAKQNGGIGIRVNVEGRTGFSYTNDRDAVHEAAETAVTLARYGEEEGFELPLQEECPFMPFDEKINEFNIDDEISRAEDVISILRSSFPGINLDMGIYKSTGSMSLINSAGTETGYRTSSYSASISATLVREDGTKTDIWESDSSLSPFPFDGIRDEVLRKLGLSREDAAIPSGRIPLILSPKAASRMMGILLGGLNGRSVYRGISPFAGKSGEALFNPSLTITDDPTMEGTPYSYPFDDEGIPGRKKRLIDRGVIGTFINDLKHAERLGAEPTGNGSRGYSTTPSPSFSGIVIDPGKEPLDDLLKRFPTAVLADQFIGFGQSNTLTGDFSAGLDLAFLVKEGEITGRVRDAMITDNLFTLMAGEVLLSNEQFRKGSMVTPWILFPEVNYTC